MKHEDITLEELSRRYLKVQDNETLGGPMNMHPKSHFQLALLHLQARHYKIVNVNGETLCRVPEWSEFSQKSIAKEEADRERARKLPPLTEPQLADLARLLPSPQPRPSEKHSPPNTSPKTP